jgi:3-methyladenine DNA glycosylase AlkD
MPRTPHTLDQVLAKLYALEDKERLAGKARYGINVERALGLSMPELRGIAKQVTKNHELAEALWNTDIHETRLIASMIDHPKWVTEDQMERWVKGFDSWDVCDQTCGELFDKTQFTARKIHEWSTREEEFVKRAGFALIAWQSVHDKKRDDGDFLQYLPLIERESTDPLNFVKKAVNWALRQVGKRSAALHPSALLLAEKLAASDDKTARWIGNDAVRELKSEKVLKRLSLQNE